MCRSAVSTPAEAAVPAPYASVEQALAFAYGMEARVVCKISSLRGYGTQGGDPYSAHAEAAMIVALVHRTVEGVVRAAIEACHTVPSDAALRSRKHHACWLLSHYAHRPGVDRYYVLDVVRQWAGLYRDHDDAWWAEHLGLSERRLRHLRFGRPERGERGIMGRLDRHYEVAVLRLHGPMTDRGIVSRY